MDQKSSSGPKTMSEKPFLMVLGPIWPKNTENPRFFEFPKVTKWAELADTSPKTSALPQSFSKMFFVSQTQKFMKIFQKN